MPEVQDTSTTQISPWLHSFLMKLNMEMGGDGDIATTKVLPPIEPERLLLVLEASLRVAMLHCIETNDRLHSALHGIVEAEGLLSEAVQAKASAFLIEGYTNRRRKAIETAKPLVVNVD